MEILLLTAAPAGQVVLPGLDLLPHTVRTAPRDVRTLVSGPSPDAVVAESGLVALSADWGVDDVVLASAGPAEIEARLRLAVGRLGAATASEGGTIRAAELTIDPDTYAAKLKGRPLDLTYKEFELLKFLAQHPGRVFTRDQLLREVWGYDYYGGTRTVDVHVRRLRAKLGVEHESLIGTVRHVGYKFVSQPLSALPADEVDSAADAVTARTFG